MFFYKKRKEKHQYHQTSHQPIYDFSTILTYYIKKLVFHNYHILSI